MLRLRFSAVMFVLCAACRLGVADPVPLKDLSERMVQYRSSYSVNPDYTWEEFHSNSLKILDKRAIERDKTTTLTYSASVESIEILEAYNQKADGTRIDAPKGNYQIQTHSGRGSDVPAFSDRASITTVFPEVEVGDTLVFSYKRRVTDPIFHQYFAASEHFSEAHAYDDVIIELSVPATFERHHRSQKMQESSKKEKDRVHYTWKWKNSEPVDSTRKDYSVWNVESTPGFAFSTYGSYKKIAEAYGSRALPKVIISDRVKALADEVTKGQQDKREQAKRIYEWVATNISYAGNCVGVGTVVPHDLSFVLDNHMGDCKDHATLLQALMQAKHIRAVQALVNAGSVYSLDSVPSVQSVNHVINYLPDFDLFVDATSDDIPFGWVPNALEGKPVLLVENYRDGMTIPASIVGSNVQRLTSEIEVLEDGSAVGAAKVSLKGNPAINARSGWRKVSQDQTEEWLKSLFTRNGHKGSASIVKDDPRPLDDKFSYSMKFEQKEFLLSDSAGAFRVSPPIPTFMSIDQSVSVPEQIEDEPITCTHGSSYEEYVYRFPNNFKILDYPANKVIEGKFVRYESSFSLKGNEITVKRHFIDSSTGPTCSPDVIRGQQEALQKISRNLRSQIVYKPLLDE